MRIKIQSFLKILFFSLLSVINSIEICDAQEPAPYAEVTACISFGYDNSDFFSPFRCATYKGTTIDFTEDFNTPIGHGTISVKGSVGSKSFRINSSLSGGGGYGQNLALNCDVRIIVPYDGKSQSPISRKVSSVQMSAFDNDWISSGGKIFFFVNSSPNQTLDWDGKYNDSYGKHFLGYPNTLYSLHGYPTFVFKDYPLSGVSRSISEVASLDFSEKTSPSWEPGEGYTNSTGQRVEIVLLGGTQMHVEGSTKFDYELTYPVIDPVGDSAQNDTTSALFNGDFEALALSPNRVWGAASDGASMLVFRVPAARVGSEVKFESNDWEHGFRLEPIPFNPKAPQNLTEYTTTAVSTSKGPMAFVGVRAPSHQDAAGQAYNFAGPIALTVDEQIPRAVIDPIFRFRKPPLVLIHGLHGNPTVFDDLTTELVNLYGDGTGGGEFFYGYDGVFVRAIDFTKQISATNLIYPGFQRSQKIIRQHSLGVEFNALNILDEIKNSVLPEFRKKYALAATRVDVVGHSMGGLIAKQMTKDESFIETSKNYDKGYINKLITIATPHLGAHQATRLMSGNNNCIVSHQSESGWDILKSADFGRTFHGAVFDLRGGEASGEYGPNGTLKNLLSFPVVTGSTLVKASYISASATPDMYGDIFELQGKASTIFCGTMWNRPGDFMGAFFGEPPPEVQNPNIIRRGDDIANWYSRDLWPRVSNGHVTDGIVSIVSSQGEAPINAISNIYASHGPGTSHGSIFDPEADSYLYFSPNHLGLEHPYCLEKDSKGPEEIIQLIDATDDTRFFTLY